MSELNLIPYSLRQKNRKRWIIIEVLLVVIVVAAVLGIGVYYPYTKLNDFRAQEDTLKASINSQSSVKAQNKRLLDETASLKELQSKINIIKASNISIYKVMTEMEQYIPGDIAIKDYNYTAGKLELSGTSKQYNSINEFQANLEESGKYINSNVATVTVDNTTGIWTFTLTIDEVKGEAK